MQHVNVLQVSLKYVSNDIDLTIYLFGNNIGIQPSLNIIETQHKGHGRKYWI